MKKTFAMLLAASSVFVTFVASAEEGGTAPAKAESKAAATESGGHSEFGQQGVIALEAATGLDVSSTSTKPPAGDSPDAALHIRLEPTFHYFVAEHLSVGGLIAFEYRTQGAAKEQEIGLGPAVGYNLALIEGLSFWPKAGLQYVAVSSKVGEGSESGSRVRVVIDAPVLVHAATHFHFGVGPYVWMDLSSKMEGKDANKNTTIGLMGTIGGWL